MSEQPKKAKVEVFEGEDIQAQLDKIPERLRKLMRDKIQQRKDEAQLRKMGLGEKNETCR